MSTERRRAPRPPLVPPLTWFPRASTRLLQSPLRTAAASVAILCAFELLHRVAQVPEPVSSTAATAAFLPILVLAVLSEIARILHDPEGPGDAVRHLAALLALVIVFCAVLYSELGIVPTSTPDIQVRGFWVALYFSAITFTSLGYGDFVPTPETRLIAATEALAGYVLLGLTVASAFFILSRHTHDRRSGD